MIEEVMFFGIALLTTCVSARLTALLRDTIAFGTAIDLQARNTELSKRLPAFRAQVLDSEDEFTDADLLLHASGATGSLLFVDPGGFAASADYDKLLVIARRIDRDTPRHIHIVCRGTAELCRDLQRALSDYPLCRVLLDASGTLFRAFQVDRRAMAVYVGADGMLGKRGWETKHPRLADQIPKIAATGTVVATESVEMR